MRTMKQGLVIAVAAALPALAYAQTGPGVSMYGVTDTFIGSIKDDVAGVKSSGTVVNSGGLMTSFWGIKGSEDLGGGLSAIFAIESFFLGDTGAAGRFGGDPFFARSAFVGLAGGFGSVMIGRNTAPYFLATIFHNPLVDSFTVGPMITHTFRGNVQGDTGFKNSIRWVSPTVGGLRADIAYSAGDEKTVAPTGTNKAFDIAFFYNGGPLSAAFAYRDINLDTGNGRDQKAWQIGASYDFKSFKLQGQVQQSKQEETVSANDIKRSTYQIGASVPMGPGAVLASWAHTKITDQNPATGDKRNSYALVYDYNLSKRTDLYAAYYNDKFSDPVSSKQTVYAFGIRHRF